MLHHQKNPAFAKVKYTRNFYYATENFENALNHAHGDYIFLSDQDDVFMPNKIERMVAALQSVDCVMCKNSVIDTIGKQTDRYSDKPHFAKSVIKNLNLTPFLGCCMAFRKDALEYILPFPKKCIGHDLWIGCLCAYKNQLVYIDEPLHQYRVHEFNVSPSVTKQSKNPLWFRIKYRLVFLMQCLMRLRKIRRNK